MSPPIDGSARKTLAVGLFFLLLAGIGWLMLQQSRNMYSGMPMPGDPGPFFLIGLCLMVLVIAGGLLFVLGLWGFRDQGESFTPTYRLVETARAWALSIAFVISLLVMPTGMRALGTTFAVALFSMVWIYVLLTTVRGHALRHVIEALLFGAGAALFVNLIFVRLLTLPLPV
jgi:hypothetical protein